MKGREWHFSAAGIARSLFRLSAYFLVYAYIWRFLVGVLSGKKLVRRHFLCSQWSLTNFVRHLMRSQGVWQRSWQRNPSKWKKLVGAGKVTSDYEYLWSADFKNFLLSLQLDFVIIINYFWRFGDFSGTLHKLPYFSCLEIPMISLLKFH